MNKKLMELKIPGTKTFLLTIKRNDRQQENITMQLAFDLGTFVEQ